jgi:DNA-binding transcriptional LysR family regulator
VTHRDLVVFKSVLDHRSFSRAAEATFLTQPAVSQAVRRLERDLGTPLLTRERPPAATPAGARLYAHAADVLARDAQARRDVEAIRHGGGGTLRLGASQALSREILPRLVRRFHASRPLAALHFETLPSRDLVRTVADGRLELGLGPLQKSMPGFARHVLGRQRMILYTARGSAVHRDLRKRGAEALHAAPLVTSSLDAPGARPGGGKLRDRFANVWEVHSLDLRVEVVRSGLAVGYLPESIVRAAGRRRDFAPVDWLDFGVILRDVGFFHLEKHALTDLAAELLRLARPV